MTRMALFIAPLALCAAVGCNDRDDLDNDNRDGVYGAPSSPLPATPGYETPSNAPYVNPNAPSTTRPGLGEGEREQPAPTGTTGEMGAVDSTGNDAMGAGAPAVPSAPAGAGSLDAGGTSATGQTPPSGDASSGTFFGQPMNGPSASGATPTVDTGATEDGATDDAADEDLNDNGIDDDEENEQDRAAP